jgi:hypothetical protein
MNSSRQSVQTSWNIPVQKCKVVFHSSAAETWKQSFEGQRETLSASDHDWEIVEKCYPKLFRSAVKAAAKA